MPDNRVFDEATVTAAEEGIVILDGPDGVAISMTPDAAEVTADRLREAAAEARAQAERAS